MSLSDKVKKAVNGAKTKLGTLLTPAVLKIKGSTSYNTSTGEKSISSTDVNVDVVIDKFEYNEIDGTLVKNSDVKLIMFNDTDYVPSTIDKISISNKTYDIINVSPVIAGSKTIIFVLQVRL